MFGIRRVLPLVVATVAAVGAVLAGGSPASAWTWTNGATVYNSGNLCVQGDAGIDHTGATFSGNLAYANVYARGAGCGAGLVNSYAAVRLDVFKWNGSSWYLCRNTDWLYGYTGVNQWGPYGPSQVYNYGGKASCGVGWYATQVYAYVSDGSVWRGGTVWAQEYVA
ncbi:hypothetical protein [Dactylosporangium sp. NPDC051541]|uniref:hypothetical protein n=1 Tax=Dactylosporangium sp. NPDC051541 TaxID=3363977 RepID=UPI0037A9814B